MACFYLKEHQHKGAAFVAALAYAGYWRTSRRMAADFIFIDHDIGSRGLGYRQGLEQAHAVGKPVFIYPHSARPNVMADTHKPWPHTRALFTISEGHKEVLEALKYPCPVEVCGWSYSDVRPFVPIKPEKEIKVLFAPIHPNNNGFLSDEDKKVNASAFNLLMNTPGINITIRHIHNLEQNGLWYEESVKVKYVQGQPDGSTAEIETADVIIGSYTLAYIAVALGKPLIMMAEQMRPHVGNTPGLIFYSKNWEKYREIIRYPYEIENCADGEGVLEVMGAVMAGSSKVEDWKRKFIGQPFDGKKFVEKVESYL